MISMVFLDASTIQYGDMDMSPISSLGSLKCYDRTLPEDIIDRCRDASVIITNKVVINSEIMSKLPSLRMIAEAATGYNNIDIAEASRRGIVVANVPGYSTESVAQLTMTFILALSSNLVKYNQASHDGTWSSSPLFTLGTWPFIELRGKTVGIMGYGSIGREVGRLCRSFNMQVVALDRGAGDRSHVDRLGIEDIARESDFISIHMPLTDYSRHLIDKKFLSSMKKTAYLINMARGPIVDPDALLWALKNNVIAGAALDVMDREPPLADDPLLSCENLIITPHIGWAGAESRTLLIKEIAANIKSFMQDRKRNTVTP